MGPSVSSALAPTCRLARRGSRRPSAMAPAARPYLASATRRCALTCARKRWLAARPPIPPRPSPASQVEHHWMASAWTSR